MSIAQRDPRSKAELLNRILSIDFDGDLRHLGPDVRVERVAQNRVALKCGETDRTFTLTVSMPREGAPVPNSRRRTQAQALEAAREGEEGAEEREQQAPAPVTRRPSRRRPAAPQATSH